MQPTGNTYTTGGTNAFQSSTSSYKTSGQGLTSSQTGGNAATTTTTTTKTTETYNYGSSKPESIFHTYASGGSMNDYRSGSLSSGLNTNTVPSYGGTGLSNQYGTSVTNMTGTAGTTSSSFTASFSGTSSGLKSSGSNFPGAGYTFQTKR